MRKALYIVLGAGILTGAILMVPHETYAGFLPRVTPPATRVNVNGGTGGYDYDYVAPKPAYQTYFRATSTGNYSNFYYSAYAQGGRRYSCFFE